MENRPRLGKLNGFYKHGLTRTKEHRLWINIKQRCLNSNYRQYKDYGGRGISLYNPWVNNFWAFYIYLNTIIGLRPGKEYSLDRINNNGNYEPGNIRWADRSTQNKNQRSSKQIRIQSNLGKKKKHNGLPVGVYFHKDNNRYIAYIGKKYLGSFLTIEEANIVYQNAFKDYKNE